MLFGRFRVPDDRFKALMRALGATGVADLDESDYDDLFWIVRVGDRVAWIRQHYGAVTD